MLGRCRELRRPNQPLQATAKSGPRLSAKAFGDSSGDRMREFQKAAVMAIGQILRTWGVEPHWNDTSVGPLPPMDYGPDDVDVHASFIVEGGRAEIWVHPDDLSVTMLSRSRIVESQDFPGDSPAQIRAFCEIVQKLWAAGVR